MDRDEDYAAYVNARWAALMRAAQLPGCSLARLGPESRAVVVLRYYADLTERQTADVLGIALGTVKSRMSRALAQLATDPHLSDLPGGTPS